MRNFGAICSYFRNEDVPNLHPYSAIRVVDTDSFSEIEGGLREESCLSPKDPGNDSISPMLAKRQYVYRNFWIRQVFRILDETGEKIFRMKRERPCSVKRVLVMRPDHLGDVLFALPALHALRKGLPKAQIDFLIGPWARSLLQEASEESKGVALLEYAAPWLMRPKKNRLGAKAVFELTQMIRNRSKEIGGSYDLAIDLRGDFQLILAARLAGVRYLVGRGHTGFGFALDAEVESVLGRHQVENNLALIESAGFGPQKTQNPRLALCKEETEQARALLRPHGIDRSKVLIGIHPGAGLSTKRWGADRFGALIRRLILDLPVRVALLGGPDDRLVADKIIENLRGIRLSGRFVDLCGRLPDLRSFMGISQQCSLFIGNDSGPSHIAAALSVPLICLFSGTNNPSEWGPRGSSVLIIKNRIECEGCGLTLCDHHSCMRNIEVDAVFQAVRRCV